jgi:acetyltransferase-like isoleucine patch superfamily enzyme
MTAIISQSIRLARRLLKHLVRRNGTHFYLRDRFPEYAIGEGTYGSVTVLRYNSAAKLVVGNYTSIADDVTILLGGEHRPDWVSTYPFNVVDPRFSHIEGHPHSKGDVTIGSDVWLGWGSTILSGTTIGDGAVIGARALVTRDVPPYAIVGGNPARILRTRFSPEIVADMLKIKWWDWPKSRIDRAIPHLQSSAIGEFVSLVYQGKL